MRIGVDLRCLAEGRRTGVEEYTISFLSELFRIDSKNEYVLFFNSGKPSEADFSWTENFPNVSLKRFNYPNKLLNFLFWYFNWPKIDRMIGGVDVMFLPNLIFGGFSKKTKLVLTVHDLSFERYPEYFSWKRRFWHWFVNPRKLCRRADRLIAVSESTREDLRSLYGVDPEKITVIPNAINDKFCVLDRNNPRLVEVKEKYSLPFKSILYLGTIEPRKNIVGIIRAYDRLQEYAAERGETALAGYKLVLAGSKGWLGENIYGEIKKARNKDKIVLADFIAEEDKECVYNLASLFIYPSFFEGFGFPPLEAMACGVPVIASNNSSLPEIIQDAGILIDPHKPDEIYKAMKGVLSDKELREKLILRGLKRANGFNWEKSAKKFLGMAEKIE